MPAVEYDIVNASHGRDLATAIASTAVVRGRADWLAWRPERLREGAGEVVRRKINCRWRARRPRPAVGGWVYRGWTRAKHEEGETMTTLGNRPNTALLVVDVQNGVVEGGHERDTVVANVGSLVEKARRERVPVVWVQHSDEQLAPGSDDWRIVPELAPAMPSRWSRRTTVTPSRTPPSRPCCRALESGDSSSSARRPMRASARRSTARSSGGTTRPLSATPTRRRTRPHGGRRRRARSSRTRTCTGATRRRRGGRPGRSRPRMSTSAARPEACATRTEHLGTAPGPGRQAWVSEPRWMAVARADSPAAPGRRPGVLE